MALTTSAREQLDALTAARNGDGGWGYTAGRASRLEPTSLALLALAAAGQTSDPSVLDRWPAENGLLIDPQSRTVNVSDNAVALLAAQHVSPVQTFAPALVTALGGMKGVTLPASGSNTGQRP